MSNAHKNWHKGWRREGRQLVHISGLKFDVIEGDGYTDTETDDSTLEEFQHYELARGVGVNDFLERIKRLTWEAQEWHQKNP